MTYDDEIWQLVPHERPPAPAHLVSFVRGLPLVDSALDLGCGDGRLSAELKAGRITLADTSQVALDRAELRVPGGEAMLIHADEPLPSDDCRFGLVLLAETIEHVRDVQLLLSECRRVLEPDGILAVTTPGHSRISGLDILLRGFERHFDPLSPHLRFFTRRSLTSVLEEHGFGVASMRRRHGTLLAVARR